MGVNTNLANTLLFLFGKPGSGKGLFTRTFVKASDEKEIKVRTFSSGEEIRNLLLHDNELVAKVVRGGRIGVRPVMNRFKEVLTEHLADLSNEVESILIIDGLVRNESSLLKVVEAITEIARGTGFLKEGSDVVGESNHLVINIDNEDVETHMKKRAVSDIDSALKIIDNGNVPFSLLLKDVVEMLESGAEDKEIRIKIKEINHLSGFESDDLNLVSLSIARAVDNGTSLVRADDWLDESRKDRIRRYEEETEKLLTDNFGFKKEEKSLSSENANGYSMESGSVRGVSLNDFRQKSTEVALKIIESSSQGVEGANMNIENMGGQMGEHDIKII